MQIVSEVMTRGVSFVSQQDSLRRAAQLMDELGVGALPVCDGERLVGMVTDRDITVRGTAAGLAPDAGHVDDVMSMDVRWCFEDEPLDEVMQRMADTQIRRVPVVSHDDAHRLVGIVSLGDLATRSSSPSSRREVEQVVEKISFPSEPDRDQRNAAAGAATSDTGTATGMAGSDVLEDRMNPGVEVSTTGDPSEAVEVTPDELVNRNAPGSTALKRTGAKADGRQPDDRPATFRSVRD